MWTISRFFSDDGQELSAWRSAVIEQSAKLRLTLHEERAYPRWWRMASRSSAFASFPTIAFSAHDEVTMPGGICGR